MRKNVILVNCFMCANLFAKEKQSDDSKYDDIATIEFCLEANGKNLCYVSWII